MISFTFSSLQHEVHELGDKSAPDDQSHAARRSPIIITQHARMMVTLRGIDVCIISQLNVRRLPEYRVSTTVPPARPSTSCFVPIHPGSQIWCDYSIFNPHPSSAIYLFKLAVNGELIASWDCTERNAYHGKAAYFLHHANQMSSCRAQLQQRALTFSSEPDSDSCVIEVCVYRAATRHRTHPSQETVQPPSLHPNTGLKMTGTRPVEPERPVRRYKYRLLDAKDEPYACFRFHPRTVEHLEKHGLLDPPTTRASSSSTAISDPESIYHDAMQGSSAAADYTGDAVAEIIKRDTSNTPASDSMSIAASDSSTVVHHVLPQSPPQSKLHSSFTDHDVPESVHNAATVDQQKSTPCQPPCLTTLDDGADIIETNPERMPRKRSLSPFTSGGFLRRVANSRLCTPDIVSGPPSADSGTERRTASAQSGSGPGWTQANDRPGIAYVGALQGKDGNKIGRTSRRWLGFIRGRSESAE